MLTADWKKHLEGNPTVFFATTDGTTPHVRPLTLIHKDDEIWFATCSSDHKLSEIENNAQCEICLVVNDPFDPQGSIRLQGGAQIVFDDIIRKEIGPHVPFSHYCGNPLRIQTFVSSALMLQREHTTTQVITLIAS